MIRDDDVNNFFVSFGVIDPAITPPVESGMCGEAVVPVMKNGKQIKTRVPIIVFTGTKEEVKQFMLEAVDHTYDRMVQHAKQIGAYDDTATEDSETDPPSRRDPETSQGPVLGE
jgi:hypothetical protein